MLRSSVSTSSLISLLLAMAGGLTACGSTVSIEDLGCPCASGFVCCDKVCVAEGACGAAKGEVVFLADGGGDAANGADSVGEPANGDTVFSGSDSSSAGPTGGTHNSGAGGTASFSSAGDSCFLLNGCCGTLPFSQAQSCGAVVTRGSAGMCASLFTQLEGEGYCNGGTGSHDAGVDSGDHETSFCVYPAPYTQYPCSYDDASPVPGCTCSGVENGNAANAAQSQLDCMSAGGTVVSACPTSGLVGCCSMSLGAGFSLMTVACSYGTDDHDELSCVASSGTWSTTAP